MDFLTINKKINEYNNSKLYDNQQLREIRLGLEDNIDISKYNNNNNNLPASEMRIIRNSLLSLVDYIIDTIYSH